MVPIIACMREVACVRVCVHVCVRVCVCACVFNCMHTHALGCRALLVMGGGCC